MKTVKLSKPTQINGSELTEITLDLESLRGRDMMELESGFKKFYRGEIFFSLPMEPRFQLWVAGRVCGINHEDLADLQAPDYYAVCTEVQNFLLGAG